jgi:hypothetical protein
MFKLSSLLIIIFYANVCFSSSDWSAVSKFTKNEGTIIDIDKKGESSLLYIAESEPSWSNLKFNMPPNLTSTFIDIHFHLGNIQLTIGFPSQNDGMILDMIKSCDSAAKMSKVMGEYFIMILKTKSFEMRKEGSTTYIRSLNISKSDSLFCYSTRASLDLDEIKSKYVFP